MSDRLVEEARDTDRLLRKVGKGEWSLSRSEVREIHKMFRALVAALEAAERRETELAAHAEREYEGRLAAEQLATENGRLAQKHWDRAEAAERRVDELRETLRCEHNRSHDHPDNRPDLWEYVEHEGKTWNRCRSCGLLELWEGGVFVEVALAERESTEEECDGSKSCTAARHVHGCFAERGAEGERQ